MSPLGDDIVQQATHPLHVQGLVQSGFLWGYMATQMIGGSLADKYGGKPYHLNALHALLLLIQSTVPALCRANPHDSLTAGCLTSALHCEDY